MKKLIIAAVVLVSMSVQAFAGPIVTIKIRIGKSSAECDNFGICWKDSGVDVSFALVANGTEGGTIMQINDNTGNLDITIPSAIWKEKSNYFSGTVVTFEEEVNLGQKISTMLKSPTPIVIKAGKYSMKKDINNNVVITIPQGYSIVK
jgi:hypothetical protein